MVRQFKKPQPFVRWKGKCASCGRLVMGGGEGFSRPDVPVMCLDLDCVSERGGEDERQDNCTSSGGRGSDCTGE